jgi:hypothetical protein
MTRSQCYAKVKRELIKAGKYPVKAISDYAGNCLICGEAGRCPGWHTITETQAALERGWIA